MFIISSYIVLIYWKVIVNPGIPFLIFNEVYCSSVFVYLLMFKFVTVTGIYFTPKSDILSFYLYATVLYYQ